MKFSRRLFAMLNNQRLDDNVSLDILETCFETYYKENKRIIDDYIYMKAKIEEFNERKNIKYKLYILNNKTSGKVISARIKLSKTEGSTAKNTFYNIHIGRLDQYKKGLKDPLIDKEVSLKIKEFLDFKFPANFYDTDNQLVTLKN
jgi:hypothetical protein